MNPIPLPCGGIDPAIFIDDDGQPYYYWGQVFSHGVRLNPDMERGKPTALGYSISKSPLGPFEYKGIIIDNADCDPESWNNHGSIECVDGQRYVFYHRYSRVRRYT